MNIVCIAKELKNRLSKIKKKNAYHQHKGKINILDVGSENILLPVLTVT